MEFAEETSPAVAFDKDAFDLTVEDVYDISYVIGRDLLKISGAGEEVSDLPFRIVRVLEMFETLVNKYNLSLEELRMERDNLKGELEKVLSEGGSREGTGSQHKAPSILQSLQSPVRARVPLGPSNMLIQETNEADPTGSDMKIKKDIPPEKCDAKEQKTQTCAEVGEKTTAGELKESAGQTKTTTTTTKDNKAPAPKNRSRAGHKKSENKAPQNKKVTDYFPIRRSNRKTKAELKSEEHKHLDDLIKNGVEEGMVVNEIEVKGRGVFAVNGFKKGDFVVEYYGDLLELSEAKAREAEYALDPSIGCYMYYFQYQTKTYCVDATRESGRMGRLFNHSKSGDCQTRLHPIDGTPHLIVVASRDVAADEELLYDYGDRSKESISAHPWLKY